MANLEREVAFGAFRWVSNGTFSLIYQIAGMDPQIQFILNVLIHIANVILIYFFLIFIVKELFASMSNNDPRHLIPLFGAALFGFHPVHVYAVAYLIQRSILLALFFSLLSILFFIQGLQKRRWLILSLISFHLAIYAKEHAVTLPTLILVIAFVHARNNRLSLHEFLNKFGVFLFGYFVIAIEICWKERPLLMKVYEPHAKSMIELATANSDFAIPALAYPLSLLTQSFLYFRYLFLWLLPDLRLMSIDIHYPFPANFIAFPEIIGPFLFLGLLICSIKMLLSRKTSLQMTGMAILSPALLFATEFSTARISEIFVLYRAYFFMFPTVLTIHPFCAFIRNKFSDKSHLILTGMAVLMLSIIIGTARNRIMTFESGLMVWQDAVQKIPSVKTAELKAYRTYNNYAKALSESGNHSDAIIYYKKSLEINPAYARAHSNLGTSYLKTGQLDLAEKSLQRAVEIEPHFTGALLSLGVLAAQQKRYRTALDYYQKAAESDPGEEAAYYNAGNIYMELAKFEKAEKMFSKAAAIEPDSAATHFNWGAACHRQLKLKEALIHYQKALKLNPAHDKARAASDYLAKWLTEHP